jgi:hypothetical protein
MAIDHRQIWRGDPPASIAKSGEAGSASLDPARAANIAIAGDAAGAERLASQRPMRDPNRGASNAMVPDPPR